MAFSENGKKERIQELIKFCKKLSEEENSSATQFLLKLLHENNPKGKKGLKLTTIQKDRG